MTQDVTVFLAILLYLTFFAWIGYRRGLRAELIVFITAFVSWIVLQERGTVFVRITNLAYKFTYLLGASLASGEVDESTLQSAGTFVEPGSENAFLFLLWILIVFCAYFITSRPFIAKNSKRGAWAAIVGGLNGMLFLAVLLPKLSGLYGCCGNYNQSPLQSFFALIYKFFAYLFDAIRNFWYWIQPLDPVVVLITITTVLAIIGISLRRTFKTKS
jgi:hypothetical protein